MPMLETAKLNETLRASQFLRKSQKEKILFYDIQNRFFYEVRRFTDCNSHGNLEGVLSTEFVCYLVHEPNFVYSVGFTAYMTHDQVVDEIDKCISVFKLQLANGTARTFDPDGGNLGLRDNELAKDK